MFMIVLFVLIVMFILSFLQIYMIYFRIFLRVALHHVIGPVLNEANIMDIGKLTIIKLPQYASSKHIFYYLIISINIYAPRRDVWLSKFSRQPHQVNTVQCRYNMVIFFNYHHKRHP